VPESKKPEATVRNQIPRPMAPARKTMLIVDVSPFPSWDIMLPRIPYY
jgi:hypothetical protein